MDMMSAFAMGQANLGKPHKVFDWKKAAKIIHDEKPQLVEAGLKADWEYTSGEIFRNGKIIEDSYTYLSSNWATPQICIDGEFRDCFVMEDETKYSADTKWPDDAKEILLGKS